MRVVCDIFSFCVAKQITVRTDWGGKVTIGRRVEPQGLLSGREGGG